MPRRPRISSQAISDELLIALCTHFFEGTMKVDDLTKWLHEQDERFEISRSRIYGLLKEAHTRGLFRLQVRDSHSLQARLAKILGEEPGRIRVVDASGADTNEQVALHGAEMALELIHQLDDEHRYDLVRVGLGGGHTMGTLAGQLALLLQRATGRMRLGFHALSSGFDPRAPETAAITFLGAFKPVAEELVGLFSSGVIEPGGARRMRNLPGVSESFRLAKKVDLVITALASAHDSAGALNRFLAYGGNTKLSESRKLLEQHGWVGDMLYQPYSETEPIGVELPVQPVSVLTLRNLRELATRKKVLLVVGPSESGRSKADALIPLLTSRKLKLWSHLVVDAATAEDVLRRLEARANA
jgi:DNA-binding transcriptional regulator LsrR (DeoR family)